jgi:16S rRNA (guanine(966)-N(2))-methyltransferase RsmD
VREALFNVLAARLDFTGLRVLDLYAGSGALGLEALSRGAASATFVEADRRAAALIRRNAEAVGLAGATVLARRVAAALDCHPEAPFDIVLADPPYDVPRDEVESVLAALAAQGWIAEGSVVVVERRASTEPVDWPAGWQPWPPRRCGDTRLEIAEYT